MRMDSAEHEIAALRMVQDQTAIYRHDMHHHLRMLQSYIGAGSYDQAEDYIRRVSDEMDAVSPVRCCENETANLMLGAFSTRARRRGLEMRIDASMPCDIPVADNHLCAMLSNALENAFNGAAKTQNGWVSFYCAVRQGKLLMEIKNPYGGEIVMKDGLPHVDDGLSHCGCRSIRTIVEKNHGLSCFEAEKGLFTLRIAIPMEMPELR